jgi:hypothetical protein
LFISAAGIPSAFRVSGSRSDGRAQSASEAFAGGNALKIIVPQLAQRKALGRQNRYEVEQYKMPNCII